MKDEETPLDSFVVVKVASADEEDEQEIEEEYVHDDSEPCDLEDRLYEEWRDKKLLQERDK